jgi:hypothetical protein
MIDETQLAELKRLNEIRSPGTWYAVNYPMGGFVEPTIAEMRAVDAARFRDPEQQHKDADFVAACSWAIPALIEEIERLKAQLAAMEHNG